MAVDPLLDPTRPLEDPFLQQPDSLADFIGQQPILQTLRIALSYATAHHRPLDHILLTGGPGLGKTTLAHLLAREQNGNFHRTSGPALRRTADLAALLSRLEPRDVLFIDEIHRLPRALAEFLYPAMERFELDIILGKGAGARLLRLSLAPFTLVGATTQPARLPTPLRDRFGLTFHLTFYTPEELAEILTRLAALLPLPVSRRALMEIGQRARGTPRIAIRLLKRATEYALYHRKPRLTARVVHDCLSELRIDRYGLTDLDRRYLQLLREEFGGGPAGLRALAAILGEEPETLDRLVEPFLLHRGFIQRTPRGRILTARGARALQKIAEDGDLR